MNVSTDSVQVQKTLEGSFDVEFFFDPMCPFAWQTSVWIRRVQHLRGISVGWRFISLKFINEDEEAPGPKKRSRDQGLEYHRICAAARADGGNDAVASLYQAWGERLWYGSPASADGFGRLADAAANIDVGEVLASLGLPEKLAKAASEDSWDSLIRAESDEALRRTGPGVGTPIITYDPPTGNSLFGPVISTVPDDETALKFYDALRVFVDFLPFSELKRSARAGLDLPLLAD